MPFESDKQRRYMFSQHPDIARKMVADAKRAGEPVTRKSRRSSRSSRRSGR